VNNSSNAMDEIAEWVTPSKGLRVQIMMRGIMHTTPRSLLLVVLSAVVLSTIAGCGSEHTLVPVAGHVSLDESPLVDAQVTFSPLGSGVGTTSIGRTDSEGRYELSTMEKGSRGATVGRHRVTVSTVKIDPNTDERTPSPREIVPVRYQDGSFVIEVTGDGTETADIEIQLPKKRGRRR